MAAMPFDWSAEEPEEREERPVDLWTMLAAYGVAILVLFVMIYFPAIGAFVGKYIGEPVGRLRALLVPGLQLLAALAIVAPALIVAVRLGRHPQSILLLAFAASIFIVLFTKSEPVFGLLLGYGTPLVLAMLASRWQPWWLILLGTSTVALLLVERTSRDPDLSTVLDWLLVPLLLLLLLVSWLKQTRRW
jgi:hypothetical protein